MKRKKILCVLLAASMMLSAAACTESTGDDTSTTPSTSDTDSGEETSEEGGEDSSAEDTEEPDYTPTEEYTKQSREIYDEVLGEFYEYYQKASDCETTSEKFAYMAVAEAKLLESGVFLPTTSNGGRYAISRVVPYTATPILWGNDSYRYHDVLVTTDFITSEDRTEIKEKYKELKGTGTYEDWVRSFLEEKGYTIKDTYSLAYASDPATWDVLATSMSADTEAIVNTYDGLLEYDGEGIQQPALAESYTVSDDGLTYTFKIREGVKWVDSQGREVADLTAEDFVTGMQHMMDAQGGLEYLVDGLIVNASGYMSGDVTDFSEVGVKAVDDYTLEYTLTEPATYFITMLGYGVFAPMSKSYYESQGGKFGSEYDSGASDYNYGKTPDNIAYCGPYLVTSSTEKNSIVFSANESYWNADNINIKTITWRFTSGEDPTQTYTDAKSGVLDGTSLTTSVLEIAKEESLDGDDESVFDKYNYISATDATTFNAFINLNRSAYSNFNDSTAVVSSMTDEQKAVTDAAVLNQHFRLAICYAVDRAATNAQVNGEETKLYSIRNSYVPGTFVTLDEDTTIDINGTATEFAAGTNYGVIVQAQLDADGSAITAYDPDADDGLGSSDGFDGWYDPEEAAKELELAIAELAEQGIEISEDNPVYIDFPYADSVTVYANRANAYKQSIESALGGKVIVNLVACGEGYSEWYYAGYYNPTGAQANYTICDVSGWGPDYGDPKTYLDTVLPDYAGYMTKALGIF